ncbi:MAG: phage minor head protein [Betaproteobacteria bacterium]|nr:phage minor head protein [Betaproteobacteria bacterium]MCL2886533.1 phage minor head protein [Betaproteobacteria bacterium]
MIRANFALTPKDAVAYFRAKGAHLAWNWTDTATELHATSFTVAKVTSFDVLQAIHAEVDRAISEGRTFAQFKDNLKPRLQQLGWWGKDAETGAQLGSNSRLRTIFRANVQSAYMAGHYKAFAENVDHRPWWQYIAILDNRTRPEHEALNGKVYRWDDPIWKIIWPPNGFNCRCRVRALNDANLEREGITPSATTAEDIKTESIQINGETIDRNAVRVDGQWFYPDVGWDQNPGWNAAEQQAQWLERRAATAPEALRPLYLEAAKGGAVTAATAEEVAAKAAALYRNEAEIARFLQGEPIKEIPINAAPTNSFAALRQWATEIFDAWGNMATSPEIGAVVLDERSVRDSLGHGMNYAKANAFAVVKDVIELGRVVLREARNSRVDSIYIAAPVRIGGIDDIVTILVHKDMNTKRMYLHSVTTKESLQQSRVSRADAKASERSGPSSAGGISTVLQRLLRFKP